jgi:hypothetical protein
MAMSAILHNLVMSGDRVSCQTRFRSFEGQATRHPDANPVDVHCLTQKSTEGSSGVGCL